MPVQYRHDKIRECYREQNSTGSSSVVEVAVFVRGLGNRLREHPRLDYLCSIEPETHIMPSAERIRTYLAGSLAQARANGVTRNRLAGCAVAVPYVCVCVCVYLLNCT